uniref:S-protein homolog n=1 Tax=Cicer arietinum TaxID=3827 RepID=A0A1S3EHV5_CICAR|nr:S-protein homolog 29-like [Cicer arietinum]
MSLFFSKFLLSSVLMLFLVYNVLGERVIVTNLLENNLDLTIHCKSRDDDLGAHLLHHGESISWKFGLNAFGTTRFYCAFHFDGKIHWYDIYLKPRDYDTPRRLRTAHVAVGKGPAVIKELLDKFCQMQD